MFLSAKIDLRYLLLFAALLILVCAPVWGVTYFINQDGSGHVYTSFVILRLLAGDPEFTKIFSLNSFAVPNASGHWLMAGLLTILSPVVVTKVIITATLGLFAGSVVWLRIRTAGPSDLTLTILLAFAVGFNWLWIQGNYNYILAAAASTFTLGLFYKWREKMTAFRVVGLAVMFVVVFISHLISFAILVGSVFVLVLFSAREDRRRTALATLVALVPIIPFVLAYFRISGSEGDPYFPNWQSLAGGISVRTLAKQMVWADPFVFISRRSFPFTDAHSNLLAVFSPVLWIAAAAGLMAIATYTARTAERERIRAAAPFLLLTVGSAIFALIGPDDFGMQNGSILRERVLIAALVFFVPVFQIGRANILRIVAGFALLFVICYQTLALWEYTLESESLSQSSFVAARSIPEGASIASVVLVKDSLRFHSFPTSQLINYIGVDRKAIVWDNYELGHYMFPVITRQLEDRKYAFELTTSNVFYLNNPEESFDEKLTRLDKSLADGNERINYLIVYGNDARVDNVIFKWYDPIPLVSENEMKILRHK